MIKRAIFLFKNYLAVIGFYRVKCLKVNLVWVAKIQVITWVRERCNSVNFSKIAILLYCYIAMNFIDLILKVHSTEFIA